MRTNYVMIDFESVQPEALDELNREFFRVFVFVGANQKKLTFDRVAALQDMGDRAKYIKISGNGPNALDFHIAYYIGQIAAGDPTAFFHIISHDAGFDPLIQHLKSQKIFAQRSEDIREIPIIKTVAAESRKDVVLRRLHQMGAATPGTRASLIKTIDALFRKQVPAEEMEGLVDDLISSGHVVVAGKKVTYNLSGAA